MRKPSLIPVIQTVIILIMKSRHLNIQENRADHEIWHGQTELSPQY